MSDRPDPEDRENPGGPGPAGPPIALGEVVSYLRRPHWTHGRAAADAEGLRHLIVLFMVTVLGVVVVSGFVWPIILSGLGGDMPGNAKDLLIDGSPGQLVLWGIVLAPLIEEVVFRAWLGARRASVYGLPVLLAVGVVVALSSRGVGGGVAVAAGAAAGFLAGAVAMRALRMEEGALGAARTRLFPVVFWGSAAAFAAVHMLNFEAGALGVFAPLAVLPQLLVGAVLGYVRMRFGLAPAIFFHGSYNALFLSIALLASGLAEGSVA